MGGGGNRFIKRLINNFEIFFFCSSKFLFAIDWFFLFVEYQKKKKNKFQI